MNVLTNSNITLPKNAGDPNAAALRTEVTEVPLVDTTGEARAPDRVAGDIHQSPSDEVRFEISHDSSKGRIWDHFVNQLPGAHIEQTSGWAQVKQTYGWNPVWVSVSRNKQILGGAMILTRRIGHVATIGYIERGPVWDVHHPDSMRIAVEALVKFARSARLAYVVIVPPYDGGEVIPLLQSFNFRLKPGDLPPTGVGRATLLLDLRQDVDTLLATMSMTKRQNIRRGLRKGVKVRVGDGTDAGLIRELMWISCERRGISPSPPQRDFFETLWRVLGPSGHVKFFVAEIDGVAVAGACVFVFGNVMQLWRVGWSGKYDAYDPNDVLHWEMIKWAKANGCRIFDFMHIRPDHARAILNGGRVKGSYSGVTEFKVGFGGQLRLLPELYCRSFHPILHLASQFCGARLANSPDARALIRKMAIRIQRFRRQ